MRFISMTTFMELQAEIDLYDYMISYIIWYVMNK